MRFFFIGFFFIFHQAFSQDLKSQLNFEVLFNNKVVVLGNTYFDSIQNDSIKINTLKFYISELSLEYNDDVKRLENIPIRQLINLEDPKTLKVKNIGFNVNDIEKIFFTLGLDSLVNVSGALGGDLDPTNGMYWSWQSGYINFKMEGVSRNCKNRKKAFHFHLGGYKSPFISNKKVTLDFPKKDVVTVQLDLYDFFNKTDLSKDFKIMSPSKLSNKKSEILSKSFSIN